MKQLVLLLVVAILVVLNYCECKGASKFCGKFKCPTYRVLRRGKGYELREYRNISYAYSIIENRKDKMAYTELTLRLMMYFIGGNKEGKSIIIGRPIGSEFNMLTNDAIMFCYIPDVNPPAPIDSRVKIVNRHVLRVYVKGFYGDPESEILWAKVYADLLREINDHSSYYHYVYAGVFYRLFEEFSILIRVDDENNESPDTDGEDEETDEFQKLKYEDDYDFDKRYTGKHRQRDHHRDHEHYHDRHWSRHHQGYSRPPPEYNEIWFFAK